MNLEKIKKRAERFKLDCASHHETHIQSVHAADQILALVNEVERLKLMTEDLPSNDNWNTEHDMVFSVERYEAAEKLYNSRPHETTFSELTFDEVLYLRCKVKDLHLQPSVVNVINRLQLLKCLIIHIENRNTWHKKANKYEHANKILRDGVLNLITEDSKEYVHKILAEADEAQK